LKFDIDLYPQHGRAAHKLTRLLVLGAHFARAALGGADSTRAEGLVHFTHQTCEAEGVPVVQRPTGTRGWSRMSGSRSRVSRSRRCRSRGGWAGARRAGAGARRAGARGRRGRAKLPFLAWLAIAFPQTNRGTVGGVFSK
jgi:hypothetical protein